MNRARSHHEPLDRRAWYSLGSGPWRDWVSVLHPPYTAWHLSYVLVGAALAPRFQVSRLWPTLLAFGLAVGVGAHALDELAGRPLRTQIPSPVLAGAAGVAVGGALALGALGTTEVGLGLLVFMGVGLLLVGGYNLELWHGRLHNGTVFALGWGSFPLLTAYYAQAATIRLSSLLGAAFAFWLSRAQRELSLEARDLRRRTAAVTGERTYHDGTWAALSRGSLLQPLERGLTSLSWSACLLGVAMVVARTAH